MSITRVIAELVVTGVRVFGKATAAAGAQAVRNFKHKPDGAPSSQPIGTGSSKSAITNQLNMSLDEAHLILNVKKEDPLEVIQKNYDRIFAANSPPPPPAAAETAKPTPPPTAQTAAQRRNAKIPTHSHYLQSKVFRALERIRAEREGQGSGTGEAGSSPAAGTEAGGSAPTGSNTGTGSGTQ